MFRIRACSRWATGTLITLTDRIASTFWCLVPFLGSLYFIMLFRIWRESIWIDSINQIIRPKAERQKECRLRCQSGCVLNISRCKSFGAYCVLTFLFVIFHAVTVPGWFNECYFRGALSKNTLMEVLMHESPNLMETRVACLFAISFGGFVLLMWQMSRVSPNLYNQSFNFPFLLLVDVNYAAFAHKLWITQKCKRGDFFRN